jgi:hypothetical protein
MLDVLQLKKVVLNMCLKGAKCKQSGIFTSIQNTYSPLFIPITNSTKYAKGSSYIWQMSMFLETVTSFQKINSS